MKIKILIFNNFGLKVTALFLALTVWILVSGKERSFLEKTFEVNVEFLNIAENIDVDSRPEKVRVNIWGTSREINNLTADDFKLKIDLKGISEGTSLNLLAEDFLEMPVGKHFEQISIHPKMISITVKKFITKEVSVRVLYKGKLKPGIKLIDRKVIPEKVGIYGYKSQIGSIDTIFAAEEIDLSEITESKRFKLSLKKSAEILRFEDTETVEVLVVVENKNKKDEQDKKK